MPGATLRWAGLSRRRLDREAAGMRRLPWWVGSNVTAGGCASPPSREQLLCNAGPTVARPSVTLFTGGLVWRVRLPGAPVHWLSRDACRRIRARWRRFSPTYLEDGESARLAAPTAWSIQHQYARWQSTGVRMPSGAFRQKRHHVLNHRMPAWLGRPVSQEDPPLVDSLRRAAQA